MSGYEVTILGPADSGVEPATWPVATLYEAVTAAEQEMVAGDYDHGEVRDLETGEVRYFYREYRVVWERS